jgi:predicted transcriptional regulator
MTTEDHEGQFTTRLYVKVHPDMVKQIRKLAKKTIENNSSALVRKWLSEAIERELAIQNKPKPGYVNH